MQKQPLGFLIFALTVLILVAWQLVKYKSRPPASSRLTRQEKAFNLHELFSKRCRSCFECKLRTDCGRCHACQHNATTSTVRRQVCLLRVCSEIPVAQRAQRMPKDFPQPWRYVFERRGNRASSCKHPACPCSQSDATLRCGFRVMCGKKIHECLHEALLCSGFIEDKAVAMMIDFLSKELGIEPKTFSGENLEYLNNNKIGDTLSKFLTNKTIN